MQNININTAYNGEIYRQAGHYEDTLKIISIYKSKAYERVFQKNNSPGKKPLLWINNPQYYFTNSELKEDDRINSKNISVFISGCDAGCANIFSGKNFRTFRAAKEAVLRTGGEHFRKRSIKELIRCGARNGTVKEVEFSITNKMKLELFKPMCTHGKEPQLKYFFNDQFQSDTRLFVFTEKSTGEWAGAILTAKINEKHIRTDLLLRRKDAPKGVMELLIYKIFNILKSEGAESWSLGDVPYIVYDSKFLSKEYWINFTGRRLRYAYNYLGLYNFKNKFNPYWYDSYICTNSSHPLFSLFNIARVSNLMKLILFKFKNIPLKFATFL